MEKFIDDPVGTQREYMLLSKYGISQKQFNAMLDDQNGRCAICQTGIRGIVTTKNGGYRLKACVDHDHDTGLTRKLLCYNCNVGLGFFKDNIRNLASAIVYLEDHGKEYR